MSFAHENIAFISLSMTLHLWNEKVLLFSSLKDERELNFKLLFSNLKDVGFQLKFYVVTSKFLTKAYILYHG